METNMLICAALTAASASAAEAQVTVPRNGEA